MNKKIVTVLFCICTLLCLTPCILALVPQTPNIVDPVFIKGSKESGYSFTNSFDDDTVAVFVDGEEGDICTLSGDYKKADILVNNVSVTYGGSSSGEFLLSGKATVKTPTETKVSEKEAFTGNSDSADEVMAFYYSSPAVLLGDIDNNGVIDDNDCDMLAEHLVGSRILTTELARADANKDGMIDISDCVAIKFLKEK